MVAWFWQLNIVKGLKIYDNVFTKSDISILSNFIDQLRKDYSGNGKLSITPDNHQVNDRIQNEVIELAVLPPILSNTINHLCEWHLLPETRKPTSCVIAFFDEVWINSQKIILTIKYSSLISLQDKFSKPAGLCKVAYDLQKPISMLFLNDTKMIFGQDIPYDHNGDCKEGSFLELSIEEGYNFNLYLQIEISANPVSPNFIIGGISISIRVEIFDNYKVFFL